MVEETLFRVGGGVDEKDVIRPEDSVSQVGMGRADPGRQGGRVEGRRSVVSMGSRAGTTFSSSSAIERRRQLIAEQAVREVQRENLAKLEDLKRDFELSLIEGQRRKREEEIRRSEVEEKKRLEFTLMVKRLEREAEDKALHVEEKIWTQFAEMELGDAQNVSRPLRKLDRFRSSSRVEQCNRENVESVLREDKRNMVMETPLQKEDGLGKQYPARRLGRPGSEDGKVGTQENHILKELTASNIRMCMPKREMEKFSGRPEDYMIFKRSVKAFLDAETFRANEKLDFLYQYTVGEPREIVKAAFYMGDELGYLETWRCFEEKYGAPEMIASEYVDKLLGRARLANDNIEGLKEFAVSLRLTRCVVDGIPYGKSELEHPKTIRTLVAKLPFHMQSAWRAVVQERRERHGQAVTFNNLLEFVEKTVRCESDPVFGRAALERESSGRIGVGFGSKPKTRVPVNVVAVEDEEEKREVTVEGADSSERESKGHRGAHLLCGYCGKGHLTARCRAFLGLDAENRSESARVRRLCYICLMPGHFARTCDRPSVCETCGKWHHSLLHRRGNGEPDHSTSQTQKFGRDKKDVPVGGVSARGGTLVGSVSVLPVVVAGRGRTVDDSAAFLDSGSAVSFCTERMIAKLGVLLTDLPEVHLWTESVHANRRERTRLLTGLRVKGQQGEGWVDLPPLYVLKRIPVEKSDVLGPSAIAGFDHLHDIPIQKFDNVDLMLGTNAVAAAEPLEVRAAQDVGEPYAVRTRLGWVIQGLLGGDAGGTIKLNRVRCKVEQIRGLLEDAFSKGFEGLEDESKGLSVEDECWVKIVEEGCRWRDGHYEIPLPLRSEGRELPHSRSAALRRAKGLQKKLGSSPSEKCAYEECMRISIEKGYAERVDGVGEWYIPHFGVVQHSKPGKVRVVYDCAAKVSGVALNDLLFQGPDLAAQLLDVLLRFREGRVAFTADIEAMFHQIRVPLGQRDYLRFLWWDGGIERGKLCEYRMASHLFGACSSPSIANYALRRTAQDWGQGELGVAAEIVRKNFYVDDCLRSGDRADQLQEEAKQLKSLCAAGGFNLNKFSSNVSGLAEELGQNCKDGEVQKCLGVWWDRSRDLMWVTGDVGQTIPSSKREVLSTIAKVYDPLGIVAPLVLKGRIIFQCIIRDGETTDWDGVVEGENRILIQRWVQELQDLHDMVVPRCIRGHGAPIRAVQLHLFGDASEQGHAAVAYTRVELEGGDMVCVFVWGRARVNPMKAVSIPRLELVAARLAARMCRRLQEVLSMQFEKVVLWTDSMTVLRYLRNKKHRFHSFVANRITEIKRHTKVEQWQYVDSARNPADEGSRGLSLGKWRTGPEFLLLEETEWPQESLPLAADKDEGLEIKREVPILAVTLESNFMQRLCDRYSCWVRLGRAVAWLTRFRSYVTKREDMQGYGRLTVDETSQAERDIVIFVQRQCFGEEYRRMAGGKSLRSGSNLSKLGVFLKDGMLRVGGRLGRADMQFSERCPLVLPSQHEVTSLLVRHYHEELCHLGVAAVLGRSRERYWIIKGHATVRRELNRCVVCRKVKGRQLQQRMADLPYERVADGDPAFTFTGVDCFGPFYATLGRGRRQEKRHGVIFTCMTIRAIHLEVVEDLAADSVLRAIRRFMARRGHVRLLQSDNGTNFVGARRELLRSLASEEVLTSVTGSGTTWKFNPPQASHFGGVWERMIRTVRRALEAVMGGKTYSDDALRTMFCEVEAAVNCRPLTIVGEDPDAEPLTPQRLLSLGRSMPLENSTENARVDCVKRWRQVQGVATQFWRRWCREYRSSLQGRQKWCTERRNLEVGDIVLVVDEAEARCHWPLGRVTEVRRSADGLVRSVNLTARGRRYTRPVSKLVLLVVGEELP